MFSVTSAFELHLEVADQNKICLLIQKLEDINSINEFKNHGPFASVLFINASYCFYEKNTNEIDILIRSDYAGKLFTLEIKKYTEWFNSQEY